MKDVKDLSLVKERMTFVRCESFPSPSSSKSLQKSSNQRETKECERQMTKKMTEEQGRKIQEKTRKKMMALLLPSASDVEHGENGPVVCGGLCFEKPALLFLSTFN